MPPKGEGVGVNPQHISQATVDEVFASIAGDVSADLATLDADLMGESYADIFTYEFQIFRMNNLGWRLSITPEDKAQWHIGADSIESDGPEGLDQPEVMNFFTGASLMRAVVATAFKSEAARQKMPAPSIHDDRIDTPAIRRDLAKRAYATKPGVMYGVTEELLEWWQRENPELHTVIMGLKDRLSDQFTQDTHALYQTLPDDYLASKASDIRDSWDAHLTEAAVRAYMWFSPSEPPLQELRVKS